MSTKTSFKRIAAVAALALTLGGFSAVSVNAAVTPTALWVTSASVDVGANTAAGTTAGVTTLNGTWSCVAATGICTGTSPSAIVAADLGKAVFSNAATPVYLGTVESITDTTHIVLGNLAADTGGTDTLTIAGVSTPGSNSVSNQVFNANQINSLTVASGDRVVLSLMTTGNQNTASGVRAQISGGNLGTSGVKSAAGTRSGITFVAPVAAGTYAMTIQYAEDNTLFTDLTTPTAMSTTFTLVVSAASGWSQGLTTAFLNTGNSVDASADVTTEPTAAKAVGTAAGNVAINLKNAKGAVFTGQTVTASVSGAGFVGIVSHATAFSTATTTRTATVVDSTGRVSVGIFADGTSGEATVTISVTDAASLATVTLKTVKVMFVGSVSKITATAVMSIGKAGGGVSGTAVANRTSGGLLLTPAVVVKLTDSNGQIVSGKAASIKAVSSDTSILVSQTGSCVEDISDGFVLNLASSGGAGFYNCTFSTSSTAVSGKSATLTWEILDPSDPLGAAFLTATPLTVTIGGTTVVKETFALDASSYTAGSALIATFTATDSAGNPVADGTATPWANGVSQSKNLGGALPSGSATSSSGWYKGGKSASAKSLDLSNLFSPAVSGDFSLIATSNNAAGDTLKVSATVEADANNGLALDAANAATDAANNAYDEAQNATQAASDALAAVTALSAQVSALIATVKSLAAMVAKIKAKVKA